MKVAIIGPFPDPVTGVSLANKVVYEGLLDVGIKVDRINTTMSSEVSSSLGKLSLKKMSFFKVYFKIYKLFSVDIVYMTPGQSFFGVIKYLPFILVGKGMNKKLIFHLHGGHLKNEYEQLQGLKKKFFWLILKSFDFGIVLSESLKNNFIPFLEERKIFVLPNFVEEELVKNRKENKDYFTIRLIFLSNLIESKGINVLLKALKNIEKRGIYIPVKIAGNLVPENNVESEIQGLKSAEYMGVVKGKEKVDLLNWGNVFCLPTFYNMEGQPISILEAMAFSNVIVTTEHAGIPDICDNRNAIFVKKNDVQSLEEKLLYLYDNPEEIERKGEYNANEAIRLYSQPDFISRLVNILKNV